MKHSIVLFTLILLLSSCVEEEKLVSENELVGNWLVAEAEPKYKTDYEGQFYMAARDSIRSLKGLKLVSIKTNAVFQQADSLNVFPGSWLFNSKTQRLIINNAGIGFNDFAGGVKFEKNNLLISENMALGPTSIEVIWHLVKIQPDSPGAYLFVPENNLWRTKPLQAENDENIKKRLSSMFHYYAIYFSLVSAEADYFSPKRVLLPVRYFRHGVGMRDRDMADNFKSLFFNEADFEKAYGLVEQAIKSEKHYPTGKDFTEEYAKYFVQLEKAVLR